MQHDKNCPLRPHHLVTVRWLADGKSADEISEIMEIKYSTALSRIRKAKEKTGTVKTVSLVAMALRKGWIS